jgi:hypothetical protein
MLSGFLIFLRIVLAISIIVKACIHTYIGHRNNIALGDGGGGFSFKVLWYFTKPVEEDYERLKQVCNFLQSGNMILLLIVIVISFFV